MNTYGTVQRDQSTGALKRSKNKGGVRRNAWTQNAACCCQGSGHGSGSGSGCPCGSGHNFTGTLRVTFDLSLNNAASCLVDVRAITGNTWAVYEGISVVDPNISGTYCFSLDSNCSFSQDCTGFELDYTSSFETLSTGLYYGYQTTFPGPPRLPNFPVESPNPAYGCPAGSMPCDFPSTCPQQSTYYGPKGIFAAGKLMGFTASGGVYYDNTGGGMAVATVLVTPIYITCWGARGGRNGVSAGPSQTIGGSCQLNCGGTGTITVSAPAPGQPGYLIGYTPACSNQTPVYITGTITVTDVSC